jgi:hypothetical protein
MINGNNEYKDVTRGGRTGKTHIHLHFFSQPLSWPFLPYMVISHHVQFFFPSNFHRKFHCCIVYRLLQGVLSSILLLDVEMARGLKNSTLKIFLLLVGWLPKKEIGGLKFLKVAWNGLLCWRKIKQSFIWILFIKIAVTHQPLTRSPWGLYFSNSWPFLHLLDDTLFFSGAKYMQFLCFLLG